MKRVLALLLVSLFLVVACAPQPEGHGIVNGLKETKNETGALIGNAIYNTGGTQKCMGEPDCDLGYTCVNSSCVLKK